jgi:hypothetical protein
MELEKQKTIWLLGTQLLVLAVFLLMIAGFVWLAKYQAKKERESVH